MKYIIFALLFILTSTATFAKSIDLYDQPQDGSKKVGTIDSEAGLVPIFSSKDGHWVKVGNPNNGEVGWIKSSELTLNNGTVGFTFTQRAFNSGNGPQGYVIQFGTPQNLSAKEVQDYFQQMHVRQQAIQRDMQQMMQDLFWDYQNMHFPVILPVLFKPQDGQTTSQAPSKTTPPPELPPASAPLKNKP